MRSTRASSFPLLKLPGEIRNRVYEFCLVPRDADGSPKPVSPYQPALTRVNRVVRSETLELFYAINKFKVYMKVFDDNDYDPGREHKYMQLLRGIRNLVQIGHFQLMNELEIQLTYAWRPHPYTEEPRPFLRARILSKGPHVLGSDWFLPEDYVYDNIDRLSVGDTDWGDVEAVDSAVELYKFRLCEKLADMDHDVAAEELEYLPCGRMCEVLRALLHDPRLSESSKRSLFLYVSLFYDLFNLYAKGFAAMPGTAREISL